jgi:hypothetical protein
MVQLAISETIMSSEDYPKAPSSFSLNILPTYTKRSKSSDIFPSILMLGMSMTLLPFMPMVFIKAFSDKAENDISALSKSMGLRKKSYIVVFLLMAMIFTIILYVPYAIFFITVMFPNSN